MTQFCLNHPERVSALVLSSPLLSTQRWVEDCNALVDQIHAELSDIDDIRPEFGNRHFSRKSQSTNTLLAESRRTNGSLYNHMWGRNEFEHSGVLGDLDFFPNLSQLSVPTLLICGEHETATPGTLQDAKVQIGNNAQLSILADAGHKTYIDSNREYLEAVRRFLKLEISSQEQYPVFP